MLSKVLDATALCPNTPPWSCSQDVHLWPVCSASAKHLYHTVSGPFLKDFIYLFMRHREKERGRDTGRGRSRLHAGSLARDSILGLQNQALG